MNEVLLAALYLVIGPPVGWWVTRLIKAGVRR